MLYIFVLPFAASFCLVTVVFSYVVLLVLRPLESIGSASFAGSLLAAYFHITYNPSMKQ
jgi:hypothetical protein